MSEFWRARVREAGCRIPPHDRDLEPEVCAWGAFDRDARELLLRELDARDFWDPALRRLFVAMRRAWLDGKLSHSYEIVRGKMRHAWSGLYEPDRARLAAIVDGGCVRIFWPALGQRAVETLRELTRKRVVVAAADHVWTYDELDMKVYDFIMGIPA